MTTAAHSSRRLLTQLGRSRASCRTRRSSRTLFGRTGYLTRTRLGRSRAGHGCGGCVQPNADDLPSEPLARRS
eukprot:6539985-Pyramimonas_sp.AAC.1